MELENNWYATRKKLVCNQKTTGMQLENNWYATRENMLNINGFKKLI